MCKKLLVLVLLACLANVASAGLITHYDFDEGSGTTFVDSVGGHNADIMNKDGGFYVAGEIGGAYNFNGTSYGLASGVAMPGGTQQTVAFWFKGNDSIVIGSGYPASVAFYSNADTINYLATSWDLYLSPPAIAATVVAGCDYSDQTYGVLGSAIQGGWHHIAMVKDTTAGTMKLYLDGALKNTVTGMTKTIPASTNLYIGSNVYGGVKWNGAIDEFSVYDNALTDAEVAALVPEPAIMAMLGLGLGYSLFVAGTHAKNLEKS